MQKISLLHLTEKFDSFHLKILQINIIKQSILPFLYVNYFHSGYENPAIFLQAITKLKEN